jgi:hypothetical protein
LGPRQVLGKSWKELGFGKKFGKRWFVSVFTVHMSQIRFPGRVFLERVWKELVQQGPNKDPAIPNKDPNKDSTKPDKDPTKPNKDSTTLVGICGILVGICGILVEILVRLSLFLAARTLSYEES